MCGEKCTQDQSISEYPFKWINEKSHSLLWACWSLYTGSKLCGYSMLCTQGQEKISDPSLNALLHMAFFVQVVMWRVSDKTHLKCKILMNSVNLGMFHHYRPIWPPVQKSHWEQMHYGKDLISSLHRVQAVWLLNAMLAVGLTYLCCPPIGESIDLAISMFFITLNTDPSRLVPPGMLGSFQKKKKCQWWYLCSLGFWLCNLSTVPRKQKLSFRSLSLYTINLFIRFSQWTLSVILP